MSGGRRQALINARRRQDQQSVPCPKCGVPVAHPCLNKRNYFMRENHQERIDAYEDLKKS